MLEVMKNTGKSPLITVAMPVFNAGKDLKLSVLSIVGQTFQDWELIIIDDGSTDNAVQEIEEMNDIRIKIIRDGANKGLAARLNECIDLARGCYFARMDQDDVSYPARFDKQLELLKGDPTLDVVSVQGIRISDNDEISGLMLCPVTNNVISGRPWMGFFFPHPTWMGKIEWFRKYRYAQPAPYFCEDQELMLRSFDESRFASVGEILFAYREREVRNLYRVIKTRWTFLNIQIRFFFHSKSLHYILLSCLVYMALVTRDVWWHFRQQLNVKNKKLPIIDKNVITEWEKVHVEILCN